MSAAAISWAFGVECNKPESKLLLIFLADNADHKHRCYTQLNDLKRYSVNRFPSSSKSSIVRD